MFTFHYILPLIVYFFYRNKNLLFGLILGNIVDLDHVYMRVVGDAPWFSSACSGFGHQCSWNFYPLHNHFVLIVTLFLSLFSAYGIYRKDRLIEIFGWTALGISLNLFLDLVHLATGFGF